MLYFQTAQHQRKKYLGKMLRNSTWMVLFMHILMVESNWSWSSCDFPCTQLGGNECEHHPSTYLTTFQNIHRLGTDNIRTCKKSSRKMIFEFADTLSTFSCRTISTDGFWGRLDLVAIEAFVYWTDLLVLMTGFTEFYPLWCSEKGQPQQSPSRGCPALCSSIE